MTPMGYLFVVTILAALLSDHYKINQSVFDEFQTYILPILPPHGNLPSYFPKAVAGIIIELLVALFLFMLIAPYRWMLSIQGKHLSFFIEFYLYMSTQFMAFLFATIIVADQIFGDTFWQAEAPFYCLAALTVWSIICFLVVPLLTLPLLCDVKRWRIFVSFFMMYFFVIIVAPLYYLIYVSIQLVRLSNGAIRSAIIRFKQRVASRTSL